MCIVPYTNQLDKACRCIPTRLDHIHVLKQSDLAVPQLYDNPEKHDDDDSETRYNSLICHICEIAVGCLS
jgi:hypothetical protein